MDAMDEIPVIPDEEKSGACGFCGTGGGRLRETGDETTEVLSAVVRSGTIGKWDYKNHPNSVGGRGNSYIIWCGHCHRGLRHKYQRYDDTNLRALYLSTKLRLDLDGIRWTSWEMSEEERENTDPFQDDPVIHIDKLSMEASLRHMQEETFRRYGHPPSSGWRI